MADFDTFLNGTKTLANKFQQRLDSIRIEDRIFRIITAFTPVCFLVSCTLVTLHKVIGEHIRCILPKEDVRPESLSTFCFIMSTYTVPETYNKSIGEDTAHFGVGPEMPQGEKRYYTYYQWVPFVLFFQMLLFMVPHYIWKAMEGKKIAKISETKVSSELTLKDKKLFQVDQDIDEGLDKVAHYFSVSQGTRKNYALSYSLCEVLNLLIIISTWVFFDKFLLHLFSSYGFDVISDIGRNEEEKLHPMNVLFPKMTKCDFHKYGPSGSLIKYDILCVLALNIINEKIFLFLWFWLIIIMILSCVAILRRVLLYVSSTFRIVTIMKKRVKSRFLNEQKLGEMLTRLNYSDWFFLDLIAMNTESIKMNQLLGLICKKILTVANERSSTPLPGYTENN